MQNRDMPNRLPLDLRSLTGADALFRLDGGAASDPAVEAWFTEGPVELRDLARVWFDRMKQCGEDVVELIHDDCPVACVGNMPFAYVNTFTRHVNVGFFRGAELADPTALLEGGGRLMRHVKLRPGQPVDAAALEKLIDAAYAGIRNVAGS